MKTHNDLMPSNFTTDKGKISGLSILLFGVTMVVIGYQIVFYHKWINSLEKNKDLENRVSSLEKKINTN